MRPLLACAAVSDSPVVIEVRGIEKSFRIPERRMDSLKERVTHPFTRVHYRDHHALRGISFDVHDGEFFGVVGRNGSGKSTLLKILASIYRPDAGRVRLAGRVAPFIELGVGFNVELTARENGLLNGVLMGLTLREARRRLDAVLEFAELEEFLDLKLKNYSSGMLARFAFAIMVQADADIMLIDEVLAVGDAAFGQKCMDVFHERRRAGKTVVLVTHDMATVQSLCHRAMLIDDGELDYIGEPEDTALRYYRLNFAGDSPVPGDAVVDLNGRVVEATLRDEAGERIDNVEQGDPIVLDAIIEAARELDRPKFVFFIRNADGVTVSSFTRTLGERVAEGQRVRLTGRIENRFVSGRHSLDCWVREDRESGGMALQGLRLLQFVVFGTDESDGLVTLETDVVPTLEEWSRS
jgi:ABC-type polysaccharide/polyol phosphate transport system ATPase subunit